MRVVSLEVIIVLSPQSKLTGWPSPARGLNPARTSLVRMVLQERAGILALPGPPPAASPLWRAVS